MAERKPKVFATHGLTRPTAVRGGTGAAPRRFANSAAPPTPAMAPKAATAPASQARAVKLPTFVPQLSDASTGTTSPQRTDGPKADTRLTAAVRAHFSGCRAARAAIWWPVNRA